MGAIIAAWIIFVGKGTSDVFHCLPRMCIFIQFWANFPAIITVILYWTPRKRKWTIAHHSAWTILWWLFFLHQGIHIKILNDAQEDMNTCSTYMTIYTENQMKPSKVIAFEF